MSYSKPRARPHGGVVILEVGNDLPLTAEEATELAGQLHLAASIIRLDRMAQKRYDMERKAIQNVLDRKGK